MRKTLVKRANRVVATLTSVALAACMTGLPAGATAWAGESEGPLTVSGLGLEAQATQVELYKVTVAGGIGGTVGVGDTLSAVATKIKTVQGTTYTMEAELEADDEVHYQWQYANTSTTTDSNFTDIEGATGITFAIPAEMQGKYLRVKAISQNTVVSTSKPYYGSTQSVSPVGPVQEAAGAVALTSVSLVSTLSNSMWVGAVVTPTAKYRQPGQELESPVPQGANLVYTWKVADSASGPFVAFDAAAYPQSSVSASGELSIGADLAGKFVRLEANAQMNTVSSLTWPVLPQGVYDLMRITFGFDTLYTGGTIYTTLQAKTLEYENDYSFGTTVPISDPNTTYQWYSTADEVDAADAVWTPIEGATDADLVIPDSVAGCYVKVIATSSKDGIGTSTERASTTRVRMGGSLEQAVGKLEFFHPRPVWGESSNMNELVAARLASAGFGDVTVKTKSCERRASVEAAHLGVSTADDETNGDVEFFTYDNATEQSYHSFSSEHQVTLVFELSRPGENPIEWEATTNIPWNLDAAQAIFDEQVKGLAVEFAEGDTAEGVGKDVTLPCKAGILWVTWTSSNEDALTIYRDESSGSALWNPYTGIVKHGSDDAAVVLTASVDATLIDTADDSLSALSRTFEFPIVVKGNPAMIADMNAALAQTIDAGFTSASVTDSATGATIDPEAVTADLQFPTTRTLFAGSDLSSGDYRVVYSTDAEDFIKANGYRGVVMRPLPGAQAAEVSVTATVTHREIPDVSYAKTIVLKVPALDEAQIDEDIAFMEQVKESVFDGYGEGLQEQDAVTNNLHAFQRAYFTADGQLHWKYDASDKADADCPIGFSPQTVADNPRSDSDYSNFVSSHPGIISDSNLLVNRVTRDIGVSITCCLTSDRFGAYYERYKADPACSDELKQKFAQLYRQKVSCTVTVKGTQASTALREELLAAADAAQAKVDSAVVSEDGTDVLQDALWVDAATMKALTDAIAGAQGVAAKDGATDAEIAAAQAQLEGALAAFDAACKPGVRAFASADQKRELAEAADDADALLGTVYSSTDGKDVGSARKWAPIAAVERLEAAVDAARALAGAGSAAADDVSAAAGELALARAAFERSVKAGLKPAPAPEPAAADTAVAGKRYTAGSGASKATYLVKTVATAKKQGTVYYAVSKVSKASGKKAVVPATVKIKSGTYRVVGISAGAFKSMKKLANVTIGKNVTKVSKGAFKNTKKLAKITIKGTALKTKASVKGALSGSKAAKLTVKVPAKFKKKAKKVFTKKNLGAPKKVTVK